MSVVETSSSGARGVGARLKQARESQKLTLDAVASELHILKRHLEAIERDDYDSLPQAAFTRGFVLSYAKHLKLDVDNVLADFEASYPKSQKETEKPFIAPAVAKEVTRVNRQERASKGSSGRYGILALLGVLGLIGAFYYYTTQNGKVDIPSLSSSKTSTLDSIHQEETAGQGNVVDAETVDDSTSSQTVSPIVSNTTTDAKADNTSLQPDTSLLSPLATANGLGNGANQAGVSNFNAQAQGSSELVFWVRRNTDITITDQTGRVVMQGTKSRGEHRAKGNPPFKLRITPYKQPQHQSVSVKLNMDAVPQNRKLVQAVQADGSVSVTLSK